MPMNKIMMLQSAMERANIDIDISEIINDMKKSEVLATHKFKITKPNGKRDSRWQTYYMDKEGNKKKVSSTTEQGLYDKLYAIYKADDEKITIASLFPIWIDKRREEGLNAKTIARNINHWNKYYKNSKIISKSIQKITADDIEKFFHNCITTYNLTTKELGNMKLIMTSIFKYAKKQNYIVINPFDNDVDINTVACKPKPKPKNTERIYFQDEKEALFKEVKKDISLNERTNGYAILLTFKLGLRIGELSALKWSDIDYKDKTIHIHRMETDDELDGHLKPIVVEYTKCKSEYGDRYLPLSDDDMKLLNNVKKFNMNYGYNSDYIFINNGERMTSRQIDNYLRKRCNHAGITEKSIHDIRRTVASTLYANNVSIEVIRDYLGHSDIKTTYSYIYNIETEEATKKLIINALNDNSNGLERTCA